MTAEPLARHRADRTSHRFGWSLAILAVMMAFTASLGNAGMTPAQERGFQPDRVYSTDGLDTIDIASGSTAVTIPIGPRFSVNGGLSYGLTLVHSSLVWEFKEINVDVDADDETPLCFWKAPGDASQGSIPCVGLWGRPVTSNAGLGWTLTMGRLIDPTDIWNPDERAWVFVGADGSRHEFSCGLLNSPCESGQDHVFQYPKDGAHLRMRVLDVSHKAIDFPDGTTYVFGLTTATTEPWRLQTITDAYSNSVSISSGTWGDPQTEFWAITDSAGSGRTHRVYFRSDGNVDHIDFASFNSDTATYTFTYADNFHIAESSRDADSEWHPNGWDVTVLTSITLPDGSSYSMLNNGVPAYNTEASPALGPDAPGTLQRLNLPTGGRYEWDYQLYKYYAMTLETQLPPEDPCYGSVGFACKSIHNDRWTGIREKRRYDAPSSLTPAIWQYRTGTTHLADLDYHFAGTVPLERWVVVTDPELVETIHHFRALASPMYGAIEDGYLDGRVWDHALPYTRRVEDATVSGLFLSSESCNGLATTGTPPLCASLLRQTYVTYAHDGAEDSDYRKTNRWQTVQRTYFFDDKINPTGGDDPSNARFTQVESSGIDGLGNTRLKKETSNFDATPIVRETYTAYNPANNTYPVFTLGEDSSGKTRWPITSPWILGLFDRQEVRVGTGAGSSHVRTEQCLNLDATTFLPVDTFVTGIRRLRRLDGVRDAHDLLTLRGKDSTGNLTSEEFYGGDIHSIGTTSACADPGTDREYRLDYTYQYGSRKTAKHLDSTSTITYFEANNEIDANTGLVKRSIDPDGDVGTNFTYDTSGRLTGVKPQRAGAWQEIEYTAASGTTGPIVNVRSCAYL